MVGCVMVVSAQSNASATKIRQERFTAWSCSYALLIVYFNHLNRKHFSEAFIPVITTCDNTMGRPTANSGKHIYPETVMAHAGRDSII